MRLAFFRAIEPGSSDDESVDPLASSKPADSRLAIARIQGLRSCGIGSNTSRVITVALASCVNE